MQVLRHLARAGRLAAGVVLKAQPGSHGAVPAPSAPAIAAVRSTLSCPLLTPRLACLPAAGHARALSSAAGSELEQLPEAVRRMLSLENASQVPSAAPDRTPVAWAGAPARVPSRADARVRGVLTCSLRAPLQMEKNEHAIREAMAKFQRHPGDTGSSEVQIAVLTERIKYMTKHVQQHRKDK
jgi:hypothetical protein